MIPSQLSQPQHGLNHLRNHGSIGPDRSSREALFMNWLSINKLAYNSVFQMINRAQGVFESATNKDNEFRQHVIQQILEDHSLTKAEQKDLLETALCFTHTIFESCIFQLNVLHANERNTQQALGEASRKIGYVILNDIERERQEMSQKAQELSETAGRIKNTCQKATEGLVEIKVSFVLKQLGGNSKRQESCQRYIEIARSSINSNEKFITPNDFSQSSIQAQISVQEAKQKISHEESELAELQSKRILLEGELEKLLNVNVK